MKVTLFCLYLGKIFMKRSYQLYKFIIICNCVNMVANSNKVDSIYKLNTKETAKKLFINRVLKLMNFQGIKSS